MTVAEDARAQLTFDEEVVARYRLLGYENRDIADDEFAEPDVDDPDDEPLPQAVRPADAVRVARLDAEVLVVAQRDEGSQL
mgnify:CR=1 FL=1